jgi:hypothetical protein
MHIEDSMALPALKVMVVLVPHQFEARVLARQLHCL